MVEQIVQADLQAFGEALVEILMPTAKFDPFKRDKDDINAAAKEDKDGNNVIPLAVPDASTPIMVI